MSTEMHVNGSIIPPSSAVLAYSQAGFKAWRQNASRLDLSVSARYDVRNFHDHDIALLDGKMSFTIETKTQVAQLE